MNNYKETIPEASYLAVPGTAHYRTIMRKMYLANENMNWKMYREDIFRLVKEDEDFWDYTIEDLNLDLNQLVSWGNLSAVQDPGIVHTITEYKNKRYQYSMTEKAVEIERMTIRLENLENETGNLSTNYFTRIEEALSESEAMKNTSLQELNEWWHMLQDDFRLLNQNYKDYLRDFYTADNMNLMQSVEFIIHKDRFIQYLNNFIRQMQLHSRRIRNLLKEYGSLFEEELLSRIADSELDIPRTRKTGQNKEDYLAAINGTWHSICNWFMEENGRKAESDTILEITNDIIRSIIENANMIVQMSSYGVSRKEDYRKFLQMFSDCESMDDADRLSAHVFGISHIEHFSSLQPYDDRDNRSSAFSSEMNLYELASHSRSYRQKQEKSAFTDRTFEKNLQKMKYLEQVDSRRKQADRYITDGILDLAQIQDTISADLRICLLSWIALANMNASHTGMTEYGKKYRLRRNEGTFTLHCQDGDLLMPCYVLEFES